MFCSQRELAGVCTVTRAISGAWDWFCSNVQRVNSRIFLQNTRRDGVACTSLWMPLLKTRLLVHLPISFLQSFAPSSRNGETYSSHRFMSFFHGTCRHLKWCFNLCSVQKEPRDRKSAKELLVRNQIRLCVFLLVLSRTSFNDFLFGSILVNRNTSS